MYNKENYPINDFDDIEKIDFWTDVSNAAKILHLNQDPEKTKRDITMFIDILMNEKEPEEISNKYGLQPATIQNKIYRIIRILRRVDEESGILKKYLG